MQTPDHLPLTVWANGVFDVDDWQLLNADVLDGGGEPTPYDLSDAALEMQVRVEGGAAGAALIDLSSETGSGDRIEVTDAEQGTFVIHIGEATLTDLMATGRDVPYEFDLRVDFGSGFEVWVYGPFIIKPGVTR